MRPWCGHERRDACMTVRVSCSSKDCTYRTLNASRYRWLPESVVSSGRLHLSCHWPSGTFPLYGFTSWLYFLSMPMSSDWCMGFSEALKDCTYRTLNASRYRWLPESVVSSGRLHLSCHWPSGTFPLYGFTSWLYFLSMPMSSDWCMGFSEALFPLLALTSSRSETMPGYVPVDAPFMLYSPAARYEIHATLAHINSRWIGTIAYRVNLNEMLACSLWSMLACLGLPRCLQRLYILQSMTCPQWSC